MYLKSKSVIHKEIKMKKFGKQSKEITLKRVSGDKFEFTLEVGLYYINGKETGVFISTRGETVYFDNFDEYWKVDMNVEFWEDMFSKLTHDMITSSEASALSHVVEELRKEVYTGINQLYIDDETWIDGLFDIVVA